MTSQGDSGQSTKTDTRVAKKGKTPSADLVTVEVTGQGRTADEAFDDAVRTALLQVAGAFVRSDTKTEADQLVQDRIIAHTQGFVERASKVGDAVMSGGRYIQRARVIVRRSRVEDVMREGLKRSSDVDGGSLHARILVLREKQASSTQLLDALFENWPACVLGWEVAEGPTRIAAPIDGSALGSGDVAFEAKIDFWVDQDKWKVWCKSAHEVLKAVAERTVDLQWSLPSTGYRRIRKDASDEEKDFVRFVTPFISRRAAGAKHWHVQCNHWGRSGDPDCLNRRSQITEAMRRRKLDSEPADSLLLNTETRNDGLLIVLCEAVESKATAYMMPNPRLAIRDGNQDGLGPDIFGPPAFVVTLKDTAGSGLGRTVLPVARYFSAFGLGFPRSAEGTGAALVEYSTNRQGFSVACSPAVLSMRDRGHTALLVPALSVWRPNGHGENILSERLTIPVGFVVADEDVRRMSTIEVELGKRVPLFPK